MTELALITRIRSLAPNSGHGLTLGIGDDCAVWRPRLGHEVLITTDQLIEGVHYRRGKLSARRVGARLVGRGLSDIAAMGGEPRLVFLNLALPPDCPDRWVAEFLDGFGAATKRLRAAWAGGDLSSLTGPVVASITVIGETRAGAALRRSGARPGDGLYVTGVLGRAPQIIHPRLEAGQRLRNLASAAIDLSDGLSTDLNHLAAASRVGAIVEAQRIPRSGSLDQALNRGEDYELLFTARPDARIPSRIAGVAVNRIGLITSGRRVLLERPNGKREKLAPGGWEHFRD